MVLPRLAPLLYANSFNEKKKLKRETVSRMWSQEYLYLYREFSI